MAMALDALDQTAASVLDGFLVRKDLVRKYSRQYPVPTYVVEFLLGRYCASVNESEINEGLAIVEKQLKDSTRSHRRRGAGQVARQAGRNGQDHRYRSRALGREMRSISRRTAQPCPA